jgi:membrane protein insertase Oxa1/YidC/SpoIIIJ
MLLPLIVAGTTWLQTKMTMPSTPPSAGGQPDQAQAMTRSMTTIMPIMFGFFALSFSVGISIYFIVSNLIGIGQYWIMNRNKNAAPTGTSGSDIVETEKPKNEEFDAWESKSKNDEKPKRTSPKQKSAKKAAKAK